MRGPTLPFAATKIYNPISLDLREKQKEFFCLSLSLLSLSFSAQILYVVLFLSFYLIFFLFDFFSFTFFFMVLSFPLFPLLDTRLNVSHSHKCTTCHTMCHPTIDASKNVKFQLSHNPTKFNGLTIFHEKNSTVKSVSSSEI